MRDTRHSLFDKLQDSGLLSGMRVWMRFARDRVAEIEITEVASSMALATVLAIVPILALSLAVFAAFPGFEQTRRALEDMLLTGFLPAQYSAVLLRYLKEFAAHAAGLTTFGLVGLAVTSLLVVDKLFVTVNRIFGLTTLRPWPQRALIYWSLLSLGPLAIAGSLTMTGHAAAIALAQVEAGLSTLLYTVGQLVLQGFGYALLYKFIPNCRVAFSHALVGGALVAVIGQIVKQVFEYYVTAGTLGNIYGAFVALPVLILWIYVSWFLFFAGAAVTATIPRFLAGRMIDTYRVGNDFLSALVILKHFTARFDRRVKPCMNVLELADVTDSDTETVNSVLKLLQRAGYVAPLATEARDEEWVLLVDPSVCTLQRAFEVFEIDARNTFLIPVRQLRAECSSGQLTQWWRILCASEALATPMAQTLGAVGPDSPTAVQP